MKRVILFVLLAAMLGGNVPAVQAATYRGEVAAWIPWWTDTDGIKDATKHIADLDVVHPFVFEIADDGSIVDKAGMSDKEWQTFLKLARRKNVDIIPTIAWFDGDAIHTTLSDSKKRADLVTAIVKTVRAGSYDGVDIDFEQKNAETINYFSLFLKELKDALNGRTLTCTIEPRTPPEDLYTTIPDPLLYANDYKAMGEYCDRVELMVYDQQRADLTLNKANENVPYAPVADINWVKKVVEKALKDIPADKVMIGIATYGRAWDVTVTSDGYEDYTRVAALDNARILELSKSIYKTPLGRSSGGEAVMTYFPSDSKYALLTKLPVPTGTQKGYENAARALLFATMTKATTTVRLISYDDATAAQDKVDLAEQLGVRGVAIFKADGQEDMKIWNLF